MKSDVCKICGNEQFCLYGNEHGRISKCLDNKVEFPVMAIKLLFFVLFLPTRAPSLIIETKWGVRLTSYHPCSAERQENPGP
jgi:hypothetical protein